MRRTAVRIALGLAIAALMAGCAGNRGANSPAGPRVAITVTEKGFEPAVVTVPKGQPVTLVVTRKTDQTCATDFVMAERGIKKPLPLNQPVEITLDAGKPGDLRYACAMDMFRGVVRVQ